MTRNGYLQQSINFKDTDSFLNSKNLNKKLILKIWRSSGFISGYVSFYNQMSHQFKSEGGPFCKCKFFII